MKKVFVSISAFLKKIAFGFLRAVKKLIMKRPMVSFFLSLGLLLGLIVLGNFVRTPKIDEQKRAETVHEVKVYRIGSAPTMEIQAKVEKTGVITIVAQSAGVVQKISVKEGAAVARGARLLSLSTNYRGANASSLQRQMAQKQFEFQRDNLDQQKEIIGKQRELAEKSAENSEELRKITNSSIQETKDQLALNESILSTIDSNLRELETATNAASQSALILSTKQLKSQYVASVNQLKQAVRSSEYQASSDNPPAEISTIQKDLAIKQLELQEKSLVLNLEVSELSYKLAQVSESLMYPSAPFAGVIERVYVRPGQMVNPGQPLFVLSGTSQQLSLRATVSEEIARAISKTETSAVWINGQKFQLMPSYVSSEATDGRLFSIAFELPVPPEAVFDGMIVSVQIPIGYAQTGSAIPYIPIDAVHQLQDNASVFVMQDGRAVSKTVTLGAVYGSYVQIQSGLQKDDVVITNRNIIDGDAVTAKE